ncbi:hypothetical protein PVMG_05969 [Plasmodium vivax Mauritania I]|uniref:Uncharacterized protein n=1 Tax=Plasmodium vivax Mauritania I TaxID=1035515 RepID=A0A0J9TK05_PLAVI|nr:hypothetical protein PVMG_05969 [Plasmodium vivax Mauritania I]
MGYKYTFIIIIIFNYITPHLLELIKLDIENLMIILINTFENRENSKHILYRELLIFMQRQILFQSYLHSIEETNKVTLKNIGCPLECGYRFITALSGKTLSDLCMYLNLWLDEQKGKHVNINPGITEGQWNHLEKLWNQIEAQGPISKCAREKDEHNISHIQERMKLMTYCIKRDFIKGLCEPSMRSGVNISPSCSAFYVFTEKHYETFYKANKCIDYSVKHTDYSHHISEKCTLYDMAKTFPKINVQDKIILYGDKSRKAIEQCKNNAKIGGGDALLSNDPVPLVDGQGRLPDAQEILHDGQAALVRDETGSEDSRSDFIQIASLSQTELTSNENGPSKPIYYAGLSTLGVVFTSTVLYKVKKILILNILLYIYYLHNFSFVHKTTL